MAPFADVGLFYPPGHSLTRGRFGWSRVSVVEPRLQGGEEGFGLGLSQTTPVVPIDLATPRFVASPHIRSDACLVGSGLSAFIGAKDSLTGKFLGAQR